MNPIRVLVADDEDSVLDVLESLIESDPGLDLVGKVRDAEAAIDAAEQEQPDVALVDVRMPGGGGVRAAREIRRRCPATRVIALSAFEDRETVLAMLRAGALAYVAKGDSTREILRAIRRSTSGGAGLSPNVVGDVAEALAEYHAYRMRASSIYGRRVRRIREVLDDRSVRTVFQPVVDLSDGRVVGVEALARFPGRPRRSPEAWFAEAANVGLLVELETLALGHALAEVDRLPGDLYLAVNVSPQTVCSPVLDRVLTGIAAERIVVELTEQAPVEDYDELTDRLRELRAIGVRVAIDDAGAGFVTLRHVVRMAPDIMKLDLTLVRDIDGDVNRRTVVSTLLPFAAAMGATLVAKGVETEPQLETLRSIGVEFGQGFLLGRPGPMPRWRDEPRTWPGRHFFRAPSEAAARDDVVPFRARGATRPSAGRV
jgi:EAL domain-containing protein (putative c-di-GMP-specific phosphodiesterase class I)/DNA-binding NarL/FixJ family response regulator